MSDDPYDDIPIPGEPVLSEEETLRQLRDDLTRPLRDEIARLRSQRDELAGVVRKQQEIMERVMEEFNNRYDGAPDARMQWMGSLMQDIELGQAVARAALAKVERER